nr:hypothetical protein [Actinomycetales bacterium]
MPETQRAGFTDIVDPVTIETLKELAALTPPVVSLLMPTSREVPDTDHDSLLFRSLADEAAGQLQERGADADAILAPAYELVDQVMFWRNQAEGLAFYANAEGYRILRLPRAVPRISQVGDAPRLLPLVRIAAGDEAFYVLALAQNSVRLFDATRDSIHQLELGSAPASMEEMERAGTREPHLQHQHAPRGTALFHGHGGADTAGLALEKFISEVAAGIRDQIGADAPQPLVLAGVAEHLPALQATRQLRTLLPESMQGNSEHLGPRELLERAWPVARTYVEQRRAEFAERFSAGFGTGLAVTDSAVLSRAAAEARVGTIVASPEPAPDTGRPNEDDDRTVAAALSTGADIAVSELPDGAPLGALLRY